MIKKIVNTKTFRFLIYIAIYILVYYFSVNSEILPKSYRTLFSIFGILGLSIFGWALSIIFIDEIFERIYTRKAPNWLRDGSIISFGIIAVGLGVYFDIINKGLDIVEPNRHIITENKKLTERLEFKINRELKNIEAEERNIKRIRAEYDSLVNNELIKEDETSNDWFNLYFEKAEIERSHLDSIYNIITDEYKLIRRDIQQIDSLYKIRKEANSQLNNTIAKTSWLNQDFILSNFISLIIGVLASFLVAKFYQTKNEV